MKASFFFNVYFSSFKIRNALCEYSAHGTRADGERQGVGGQISIAKCWPPPQALRWSLSPRDPSLQPRPQLSVTRIMLIPKLGLWLLVASQGEGWGEALTLLIQLLRMCGHQEILVLSSVSP